MKKRMLFAAIVIAAMGATAQDVAKKGCNPKACKPGNTKVEEAMVITELREKVVELSELVTSKGIKPQDLTGSSEEESLKLISSEVKRLSILFEIPEQDLNGSGAKLLSQLQSTVEKITVEASKTSIH